MPVSLDDLIYVVVRQAIDDLLPKVPSIDELKAMCIHFYHQFSAHVINDYHWLLNKLEGRRQVRALHGREAMSSTELLRYKSFNRLDDLDTDTDDAISLGTSTICTTTVKNSDLETELAKIRDNMSAIFQEQMAKMQETIAKQAEVIEKQAESNNEILKKLDGMMQHIQAPGPSNVTSTPVYTRFSPSLAPITPAPVMSQPPKAPPLPPNLLSKSHPLNNSCNVAKPAASQPTKKPAENFKFSKSSGKENQEPENKALGYNYISELAAQLQKRREVIERNDNLEYDEPVQKKKSATSSDSIVSSMLTRIPEPSSPFDAKFSESRGSACSVTFGDADWEE